MSRGGAGPLGGPLGSAGPLGGWAIGSIATCGDRGARMRAESAPDENGSTPDRGFACPEPRKDTSSL